MRKILFVVLTGALLAGGFSYGRALSADIQAQIQALLEQVAALQAQLQKITTAPCDFTRDLLFGARGEDVKCLQQYLNVTTTGFFGSLTKDGVAKWQTANNISPALGYFGSISRKKYKELTAPALPAEAPSEGGAVPVATTTPVPESAPAPAPAPISPAASIKSGSGTVVNDGFIKIGVVSFRYNGSGADNRGHLYSEGVATLIGNLSAFDDYSTCENTKAYSYNGPSNICLFTDPSQFNFSALTGNGVRFYDKIAYKVIYPCNTGILLFKQKNLYGALDFERIDKDNNLRYRYWLDESGGTNFGSLCTSRANINKLASLLEALKSALQKLKEIVR